MNVDNLMVGVYWALSLFWIITVSITVSYLVIKTHLRKNDISRMLLIAFMVLGIILMSDSIYWSIATSARVGILNDTIADLFYDSWMVVSIKTLFLIAAAAFLFIMLKSFRHIDFQIERLFFTQFVEQSVDAIGVLDTHGRVVYWNSGAEKLYGHKRHSTIGKHIKDFLVPKQLHFEVDEILKQLSAQASNDNYIPERFMAPRLRADKTEIMVDITITPFKNGSTFGGFFGVMRPYYGIDEMTKPLLIKELSVNKIEKASESSKESNHESVYSRIAQSLELQQKEFSNKRKYAFAFAIFLLLVMSVSLILTVFSEDQFRYIFGSSSFLSMVGGFWPIKFLIQNSTESFKMGAIRDILKKEGIDKGSIEEAMELIENIDKKIN